MRQALARLGGQVASTALAPVAPIASAAVELGVTVERRALDLVLESRELERIVGSAADSPRLEAGVRRALDSNGARRLVDDFFDSGLFDHFVDRLLASDALWRLVDEIAASPAVTAAISHQGLSFADQVGGEVRTRSRAADDWLERAARRIAHRRARSLPADGRPLPTDDRALPADGGPPPLRPDGEPPPT